jgi:hypothetical protein
MTIILVLMFMPVQSVFAAMVGTEAVLGHEEMQSVREKVRIFLDRRDVQEVLIILDLTGVTDIFTFINPPKK